MQFQQILEQQLEGIKRLWLDVDGVCIDSEYIAMKAALEVINDVSKTYGFNLPIDNLILDYAGWHFDNMIIQVAKDMTVADSSFGGFTEQDVQGMQGIKKQRTLDELALVKTMPGIEDLVEAQLIKGVPVALVTSSELERINVCLKASGLDKYFAENKGNVFCGPDLVGHANLKPKPHIYQYAQQNFYPELQGQPDMTIEDSLSGAKAGVAAGIAVVGYVAGSHIPSSQKEIHGNKLVELGAVGYIKSYKI